MNSNIKNGSDENINEEPFVFIYPKRLVLIHSKTCDFCRTNNEKTHIIELIHLFGYQHCKECHELCQKHISLFCKYKNNFPTKLFCHDFNIKYNQKFTVQRSDGSIENDWFISTEEFIKFRNGRYLIPLFSGNTFKYVPLLKCCTLNKNMIYNDIVKYFTDF